MIKDVVRKIQLKNAHLTFEMNIRHQTGIKVTQLKKKY